ncbi:MAG TPA: DUF1320 family protein [Opitutaceae bacterium]|nr:DUF1320 family protein [Opitutaceae bacterium]
MPAYTTLARINAVLPPQFLVEALDDDKDGVADPGVFDEVVASVQVEIDGVLGARYSTPFANPVPALVADAALKLTAEALYARRGFAEDKNPWAVRAKAIRTLLGEVAAGSKPLTPDLGRKRPSASVITSPAKTHSKAGRTAV